MDERFQVRRTTDDLGRNTFGVGYSRLAVYPGLRQPWALGRNPGGILDLPLRGGFVVGR
ncbi:MAG: hypothetical protein ACI9VS_000582 [Candidatus Binatia bacterium]